jgi:hypothetical protein
VRRLAIGSLTVLGLALGVSPSWGAIGFVAQQHRNTAGAGATSLTINAADATPGNVEIATLAELGTQAITAPSGWTVIIDTTLGSAIRQVSYWHLDASGDTGWTWSVPASTEIAGGIAAYSGVDNTIIADVAAAATATNVTTVVAPSVTTNYASDQVIGSGSWDATGGATADPATSNRYSAHTTGNAIEVEDTSLALAGATLPQTIAPAQSPVNNAIAQTIALKAASASGFRSVSTSSSPTFNANLDVGDQTPSYTLPLATIDSTASGAGWKLTITSTAFTAGTHTLATSASSITGISATCAEGNCTAPTNSVAYPVAVPAGAGPPSAVKFFNAAAASGKGNFTVTPTISVSVPQNSFAGSYTSTLTIAVASGP